MVTHRDRLVILSFMASPYQNTSNGRSGEDDQNDTKIDRTAYIENNDLSHTHLIEKFHAGNSDENDYFDTHEKLEAETVAPATVGTTAITTIPAIKSSIPKPNSILSSATSQNAAEIDGTRKNGGRMRNRNNGNGGRREKANRKNSDESNRKVDFGDEFGDERTTAFSGITKLPKKFGNSKEARIVDIVDEAVSGGVTQRKTMPTKDSNIHIVKTVADGILVPSTPISTDSKIIEIKPSTVGRHAKKQKRSVEAIPFRTDDTILSEEDVDEQGDDDGIDDDDAPPPPPRIYVNVDSDDIAGAQTENTDSFFRTFRLSDDVHLEGAEAAPLIGSAVPINATAAAPVHMNGIAAYLNKYLNVNKAIGTLRLP